MAFPCFAVGERMAVKAEERRRSRKDERYLDKKRQRDEENGMCGVGGSFDLRSCLCRGDKGSLGMRERRGAGETRAACGRRAGNTEY